MSEALHVGTRSDVAVEGTQIGELPDALSHREELRGGCPASDPRCSSITTGR